MKSLAELQAIRDRAKANVALRKENPDMTILSGFEAQR